MDGLGDFGKLGEKSVEGLGIKAEDWPGEDLTVLSKDRLGDREPQIIASRWREINYL